MYTNIIFFKKCKLTYLQICSLYYLFLYLDIAFYWSYKVVNLIRRGVYYRNNITYNYIFKKLKPTLAPYVIIITFMHLNFLNPIIIITIIYIYIYKFIKFIITKFYLYYIKIFINLIKYLLTYNNKFYTLNLTKKLNKNYIYSIYINYRYYIKKKIILNKIIIKKLKNYNELIINHDIDSNSFFLMIYNLYFKTEYIIIRNIFINNLYIKYKYYVGKWEFIIQKKYNFNYYLFLSLKKISLKKKIEKTINYYTSKEIIFYKLYKFFSYHLEYDNLFRNEFKLQNKHNLKREVDSFNEFKLDFKTKYSLLKFESKNILQNLNELMTFKNYKNWLYDKKYYWKLKFKNTKIELYNIINILKFFKDIIICLLLYIWYTSIIYKTLYFIYYIYYIMFWLIYALFYRYYIYIIYLTDLFTWYITIQLKYIYNYFIDTIRFIIPKIKYYPYKISIYLSFLLYKKAGVDKNIKFIPYIKREKIINDMVDRFNKKFNVTIKYEKIIKINIPLYKIIFFLDLKNLINSIFIVWKSFSLRNFLVKYIFITFLFNDYYKLNRLYYIKNVYNIYKYSYSIKIHLIIETILNYIFNINLFTIIKLYKYIYIFIYLLKIFFYYKKLSIYNSIYSFIYKYIYIYIYQNYSIYYNHKNYKHLYKTSFNILLKFFFFISYKIYINYIYIYTNIYQITYCTIKKYFIIKQRTILFYKQYKHNFGIDLGFILKDIISKKIIESYIRLNFRFSIISTNFFIFYNIDYRAKIKNILIIIFLPLNIIIQNSKIKFLYLLYKITYRTVEDIYSNVEVSSILWFKIIIDIYKLFLTIIKNKYYKIKDRIYLIKTRIINQELSVWFILMNKQLTNIKQLKILNNKKILLDILYLQIYIEWFSTIKIEQYYKKKIIFNEFYEKLKQYFLENIKNEESRLIIIDIFYIWFIYFIKSIKIVTSHAITPFMYWGDPLSNFVRIRWIPYRIKQLYFAIYKRDLYIHVHNLKVYLTKVKFYMTVPIIYFMDNIEYHIVMRKKYYKKFNITKYYKENFRTDYVETTGKAVQKLWNENINLEIICYIKEFTELLEWEDFNTVRFELYDTIQHITTEYNYCSLSIKNIILYIKLYFLTTINIVFLKKNYNYNFYINRFICYLITKNITKLIIKLEKFINNIIHIILCIKYIYIFIIEAKTQYTNNIYTIKNLKNLKNYKINTWKSNQKINIKIIATINLIFFFFFLTYFILINIYKYLLYFIFYIPFKVIFMWYELQLTSIWLSKLLKKLILKKKYLLKKLILKKKFKRIVYTYIQQYIKTKNNFKVKIYNKINKFKFNVKNNKLKNKIKKIIIETYKNIDIFFYLLKKRYIIPLFNRLYEPIWLIHRHTVYAVFIISYWYTNEFIMWYLSVCLDSKFCIYILNNSLLWVIHYVIFNEYLLQFIIPIFGTVYILSWSYKIIGIPKLGRVFWGVTILPVFIELNRLFYMKLLVLILNNSDSSLLILYYKLHLPLYLLTIFNLYQKSLAIIILYHIYYCWKNDGFRHPFNLIELPRWYFIKFPVFIFIIEYFRYDMIYILGLLWPNIWYYSNIGYIISAIYEYIYVDSSGCYNDLFYWTYVFCKYFFLKQEEDVLYIWEEIMTIDPYLINYSLDLLCFWFTFFAVYLHYKDIFLNDFTKGYKFTMYPTMAYTWPVETLKIYYAPIIFWVYKACIIAEFHLILIYWLMLYSIPIFLYFEITNHVYPYKTKPWFHKFITEFWPSLVNSYHKAMEIIPETQHDYLVMRLKFHYSEQNEIKQYDTDLMITSWLYKCRKHKKLRKKMYYYWVYQNKRYYYFFLYSCYYQLMLRMENMLKELILIGYKQWMLDWFKFRYDITIYSWKIDWWDKHYLFLVKKAIVIKNLVKIYKKNTIPLYRFAYKHTFFTINYILALLIELKYLTSYSIWLKLYKNLKINIKKMRNKNIWCKWPIRNRSKRYFLAKDFKEHCDYIELHKKKLMYMDIIRRDIVRQNYNELDEYGNPIEISWPFDLYEQYQKEGWSMFTNPEIDKRLKTYWPKYRILPNRVNFMQDKYINAKIDFHITYFTLHKYLGIVKSNPSIVTSKQLEIYLETLTKEERANVKITYSKKIEYTKYTDFDALRKEHQKRIDEEKALKEKDEWL